MKKEEWRLSGARPRNVFLLLKPTPNGSKALI
jgi:hypothetical protein